MLSTLLPVAHVFASCTLAGGFLLSSYLDPLFPKWQELRFVCFLMISVTGWYYSLKAWHHCKKKLKTGGFLILPLLLRFVHTAPWTALIIAEKFGLPEKKLVTFGSLALACSLASSSSIGISILVSLSSLVTVAFRMAMPDRRTSSDTVSEQVDSKMVQMVQEKETVMKRARVERDVQ